MIFLQACTSPPARVNYYDFGAVNSGINPQSTSQPHCNLPPLYLANINVPSIFASDAIHYRLLYNNDLEARTYASYRWSMFPAELLAQRIKTQLEQTGVVLVDNGMSRQSGLELRLTLDDFTHYFNDFSHSYAQITLRASLLRGQQLLAQNSFAQQADADASDAPAGVRAMRIASDELIVKLNNWLCSSGAG